MSMTFTKNAIDALNAASSCARQLGHDHIGAEHIFLSILAIPKCQACQRLERIGLSVEDLTESMRSMIAGNGGAVMQRGQLPLTARTKKVLDIACMEAGGPGKPINTVHLVTAMMREGENAAAQLLFNAGVNVEKFLAAGTQGGGNAEEKAGEPSDDAPEATRSDATSPTSLARGSSIPSSDATRSLSASSRSSRAARRTTPSSSERRASARPPS